MILETKRLYLLSPKEVNPKNLVNYYIKNKDFLKDYEPTKESSYYTEDFQKSLLTLQQYDFNNCKTYKFYIYIKDDKETPIGFVSLSNVILGAFRSCFLGYQLDKDHLRLSYTSEAVSKIVSFAFDELNLHRIEGNVMPKNTNSIKVLENCGFEKEGLSKSYLKINRKWEDHFHYVKLNHQVKD